VLNKDIDFTSAKALAKRAKRTKAEEKEKRPRAQ